MWSFGRSGKGYLVSEALRWAEWSFLHVVSLSSIPACWLVCDCTGRMVLEGGVWGSRRKVEMHKPFESLSLELAHSSSCCFLLAKWSYKAISDLRCGETDSSSSLRGLWHLLKRGTVTDGETPVHIFKQSTKICPKESKTWTGPFYFLSINTEPKLTARCPISCRIRYINEFRI